MGLLSHREVKNEAEDTQDKKRYQSHSSKSYELQEWYKSC